MKLIRSHDGSLNACNAHYNEYYASMKEGAFSEKVAKHIAPAWEYLASILRTRAYHTHYAPISYASTLAHSIRLQASRTIHILDIFFGLGYNALLSRIFDVFNTRIHITSIELEPSLLIHARHIHKLDSATYRKLLQSKRIMLTRNISLQILWGDGKHHIKHLCDKGAVFDIVYQDPFSYTKMPAYWSKEHFYTLASLMKPCAIMSSYATRSDIITNAQSALLTHHRYAPRPSTIATLHRYYAHYYAYAPLLNNAINIKHKRISSIFIKDMSYG